MSKAFDNFKILARMIGVSVKSSPIWWERRIEYVVTVEGKSGEFTSFNEHTAWLNGAFEACKSEPSSFGMIEKSLLELMEEFRPAKLTYDKIKAFCE
jgi:hypothetical protein